MISAVDTKLSGVSRLRLPAFLRLVPGRGQLVGILVPVSVRVLEGSAEGGIRRDRLAVQLVAFHDSKGQAEREGGVGIDRVALVLEKRLGDQRVVGGLDSVDVVFPLLADCAGIGVDGKGQLDHRVVAALDDRLARLGKLLSHRDVRELRVCHEFMGGLLRRAAPQDLLDQAVVRHGLPPVGQRLGKFGLFILRVDGSLREQSQLERLQG